MKKVERLSPSASTMDALSALTTDVVGAVDPKARAAALWKTKPKQAFSEVRAVLKRMASGRECCMYCEDNEGTDIEHFWPESEYPESFFLVQLLAGLFALQQQPQAYQFPLVHGRPALLDPTSEDPDDAPSRHLRLLPSNGHYQPIGPKGDPSITVFDLNGDERGRKLPEGRRDAFNKLQVLIIAYDNFVRNDNHAMAHNIKRAIINEPFAGVLVFLLDLVHQVNDDKTLMPGVAKAIQRHRVAGW